MNYTVFYLLNDGTQASFGVHTFADDGTAQNEVNVMAAQLNTQVFASYIDGNGAVQTITSQ